MYHSAQLGVMPVTEWNPLDSVQPDFKPRSGDGGKYRERMPRNGNGRCTAAFRWFFRTCAILHSREAL